MANFNFYLIKLLFIKIFNINMFNAIFNVLNAKFKDFYRLKN